MVTSTVCTEEGIGGGDGEGREERDGAWCIDSVPSGNGTVSLLLRFLLEVERGMLDEESDAEDEGEVEEEDGVVE